MHYSTSKKRLKAMHSQLERTEDKTSIAILPSSIHQLKAIKKLHKSTKQEPLIFNQKALSKCLLEDKFVQTLLNMQEAVGISVIFSARMQYSSTQSEILDDDIIAVGCPCNAYNIMHSLKKIDDNSVVQKYETLVAASALLNLQQTRLKSVKKQNLSEFYQAFLQLQVDQLFPDLFEKYSEFSTYAKINNIIADKIYDNCLNYFHKTFDDRFLENSKLSAGWIFFYRNHRGNVISVYGAGEEQLIHYLLSSDYLQNNYLWFKFPLDLARGWNRVLEKQLEWKHPIPKHLLDKFNTYQEKAKLFKNYLEQSRFTKKQKNLLKIIQSLPTQRELQKKVYRAKDARIHNLFDAIKSQKDTLAQYDNTIQMIQQNVHKIEQELSQLERTAHKQVAFFINKYPRHKLPIDTEHLLLFLSDVNFTLSQEKKLTFQQVKTLSILLEHPDSSRTILIPEAIMKAYTEWLDDNIPLSHLPDIMQTLIPLQYRLCSDVLCQWLRRKNALLSYDKVDQYIELSKEKMSKKYKRFKIVIADQSRTLLSVRKIHVKSIKLFLVKLQYHALNHAKKCILSCQQKISSKKKDWMVFWHNLRLKIVQLGLKIKMVWQELFKKRRGETE